jgi:hypothetical protein
LQSLIAEEVKYTLNVEGNIIVSEDYLLKGRSVV